MRTTTRQNAHNMYLRMKKLLFIASEYASGMIPFATTIINTLSQDRRFEVHCICVNSRKSSYEGLIVKEAHPVFVDYPEDKIKKMIYKIWPFRIIDRIRMACDELNPDVIHFLTGDFTLATYISLHVDERFYYTVHDLHPHEVKTNSIMEYLIFKDIVWGYKKCRDAVENLTTSSSSQLIELKAIYKSKKCILTPFPTLVTEAIRNGKRIPGELRDIDGYILFFGSVNTYKGVDLLLEAFERSKVMGCIKLVIAGRGESYEIHSDNIIRINRFIDDEEVSVLFKKARLVVYPYISATMSGVLSLAYFFDKLVLASDIPFFREYATENVSFFQVGSIDSLQESLETMVARAEDYHVEKLGYERLYSGQALSEAYWNLYND